MSKNRKINDEIDLIKFIIIILNYKFSVLIITSVIFLSYFVINIPNFSKKNFQVSIGYNIIYHPARIIDLCSTNYVCMNEQVSEEIITLLGDDWYYNKENQKFLLVTSSPMSKEKYLQEFNKINKKLTQEIYDTAVNDLNEINKVYERIEQDLKSGIQYRTYPDYNETLIKTKRLIYSIDKNGKKALHFGRANIKEISNNNFPKLIVAFIFGIIISILYVIIINAFKRVRKP